MPSPSRLQTSIEDATTNTINAAIAKKQTREAEAEAQTAAHAQAQAARNAQAQAAIAAQAYAYAQAQAQLADQAAEQALAATQAAIAAAQHAREIREEFQYTMRTMRRHALGMTSDVEREVRGREETWNAFQALVRRLEDQRGHRGETRGEEQEPRPSPPPAAEEYHHCDFDHCNGLCTYLKD